MLSIWDANFIVIDVETTGGNPLSNRLMDIACVATSGGIAVEKFQSLINPHQFIPIYIQQMTRISNEMVFTAPEAIDILPIVRDFLVKKDAVFTAHNVNFDYKFVRTAFEENEIDFPKIPKLCTVKLSRRLLRKDMKKNVGALAEYFGIKVTHRHSALGDAYATSQILCELLEIAEDEHSIKSVEELLEFQNKKIKNFVPQSATQKRLQEKLDQLPSNSGVYYFMNKEKEVHYVGKAKNLSERVMSYFTFGNITSRKISAMLRKTYHLDWENTNSELSALIHESRKIKELMPYYNTLEKSIRRFPFIRLTIAEDFPRVELVSQIENDGSEYFGPFRSRYLAEILVDNISRQFKLRKCETPIHPKKGKRPCFYYHIDRCSAPCAMMIDKEGYMSHLEETRYYLTNYAGGIISQLESKMYEFSDKLQFEQAAEIKNQIKELKTLLDKQDNIPTALNRDNFIMIFPSENKGKLLQILLIRCGKLEREFTIDRKTPLDEISQAINELYFDDDSNIDISEYNQLDINDLSIINSWIFRNKDKAEILYLNNIKFQDAIDEITNIIQVI